MANEQINTTSFVKRDILAYQNSTFQLGLRFKDKATGNPIDLTGAETFMEIRNAEGVLQLSFKDGDGVTKLGNLVTFQKEMIIAPGKYPYDIWLVKAGIKTPYFKGVVIVEARITQIAP